MILLHVHMQSHTILCWRDTGILSDICSNITPQSDRSNKRGHFHHQVRFSALTTQGTVITHCSVCNISHHPEQLNIISHMIALMWSHIIVHNARWSTTPVTIRAENTCHAVTQHAVVSYMSAWVPSPDVAGNAKPLSSLLPRQQAMYGRRKMLWEKKDEEPPRGAQAFLKW